MVRKAYINIQCEPKETVNAVKALREIPGVLSADAVAGKVDIIVTVETRNADDIAKIVLNRITEISGVQNTDTSFVMPVE